MIENRAILVSVHLKKMSSACTDKNVTTQVLRDKFASGNAGKWSTEMFPNGALSPIAKIDGEIRKYVAGETLPWADSGTRLLPQCKFFDYSNELSNFSTLRNGAINEFFLHYQDHIDEAKRTLGSLFRPELYPNPGAARKKFSFTSDVQPVPTVGDFRTDAPKAELQEMEESLRAKMERAAEIAERGLAERIAGPLTDIFEKLSATGKNGKPKTFHDSLIGNLRSIVNEIPAFNITGNPKFDELYATMSSAGSLANLPPSVIRETPELRKIAVGQAEQFLAKIEDIFGPGAEVAEEVAA